MEDEVKKKKRFYMSLWFWIVLVVLAVWFIVHDMNQATIKTKSMGEHTPKSTAVAFVNRDSMAIQSLNSVKEVV
jgi:hypothetical protein